MTKNEEAIKNIKEHCYFTNLIPQAKEALDMAIEALEQTRWIPVSERLPEPQENGDKDYSDWLLITINLGNNDTHTGEAYYCFSEKRWYAKRFAIGEVTAWMSRPKPYKAGKEDKE